MYYFLSQSSIFFSANPADGARDCGRDGIPQRQEIRTQVRKWKYANTDTGTQIKILPLFTQIRTQVRQIKILPTFTQIWTHVRKWKYFQQLRKYGDRYANKNKLNGTPTQVLLLVCKCVHSYVILNVVRLYHNVNGPIPKTCRFSQSTESITKYSWMILHYFWQKKLSLLCWK